MGGGEGAQGGAGEDEGCFFDEGTYEGAAEDGGGDEDTRGRGARAAEGALWLDLRTVGDHEADALAAALRDALASVASPEHALAERPMDPRAHEEDG